MQINVKVITSDSQIYEMAVDNELSVREFKNVIGSKISIAPVHQRIIFGGRVLLDQSKLKSYDLDGKEMHVYAIRRIQQRMCDHLRHTEDNLMRQQYEARLRNAHDRQMERILRRGRMIAQRREAAAAAASSTTTDPLTPTSTTSLTPTSTTTSVTIEISEDES